MGRIIMEKFAICIDNSDYEVSLEKGKVYRILDDKKSLKHGMLRVIDESGEDYLHPSERFYMVKLEKPLLKKLFPKEKTLVHS
jgi:hypothetical protein